MKNPAVFLALSTVALAACGHSMAAPEPVAKAPERAAAVLEQGSQVPESMLRDAMEERVGMPEMGSALVVQSWTWHPRGAMSYVVWVTCRGEGEGRLCAMAAAPTNGGFVTVRAEASLGTSPASAISADAESLRVFVDDAHGGWTQSLSVIGQSSIAIGE